MNFSKQVRSARIRATQIKHVFLVLVLYNIGVVRKEISADDRGGEEILFSCVQ